MSVEKEIEELLERLTESEKQDLLESLRKRYAEERKELKNIYNTTNS
jgi:vacuolar-type H+-ATPase subunit H